MKRATCILLLIFPGALCLLADVDTKDGAAVTTTTAIDGVTGTNLDGADIASGGGGAGPDVYYYTNELTDTAFGDGSTSSGWQPQNFNYGSDNVVVGSSGTCTSLGVFCNSNGAAFTFKIGLYNAAGTLIASGTSGSISNTGAKTWVDVTVNVAVSAATYTVSISGSSGDASWGYDTGTDGVGAATTYAASMPASEPSWGVESGSAYGVRMYVD